MWRVGIFVVTGILFVVGIIIASIAALNNIGPLYNIIAIAFGGLGALFTLYQIILSFHSLSSGSGTLPPPPPPPTNTGTPPSPLPPPINKGRSHYVLLVTSVLFVIASIFLHFYNPPPPKDLCATQAVRSISASSDVQLEDDQCIGISDGGFSFDTNLSERQDEFKLHNEYNNYNELKQKVLEELKAGKADDARSLWASAGITNDAEMLIYFEDQDVLNNSHNSYINLVVVTTLTGVAFQAGRDILQGAYMAQLQANRMCEIGAITACTRVRLLIANTGSSSDPAKRGQYANALARLIVQKSAEAEYNIRGVMGWPYSDQSEIANSVLRLKGIPMISPSASADELHSGYPAFWRIVPRDTVQAQDAALFALNTLQAKKVVVFLDSKHSNQYSSSLGNAFVQQFKSGLTIQEQYETGKTSDVKMEELLRDAFRQSYDFNLIYFAGYPEDASFLLDVLPSHPGLSMLGGDALYNTGEYTQNGKPVAGYPYSAYNRLYFTAFAYPDEWQGLSKQPAFFCDYAKIFDNKTSCPPGYSGEKYHYNRAGSDVILSYDASNVLIQGCKLAFAIYGRAFSPENLNNAIGQLSGDNTVQGISGQISLGHDGSDPANKAVVILQVDGNGRTTPAAKGGIQGCFQEPCNNAAS